MIVFDLRCAAGHVFEAWFGSSAAFADQRATGQVACPLCGSLEVDKAVMAPGIAAKGNSRAGQPSPAMVKQALALLAERQAKALSTSQWVGGNFAKRARAMHAGDEPSATIHGQATMSEAKAMVEDGIPVAPSPLPVIPPGTAH